MHQMGQQNYRLLIIDDNEAIHEDFRKVLLSESANDGLEGAAAAFFGEAESKSDSADFEIESALQGREGYEKVAAALSEGRPFSVAFVDMRMPPGWDGVETIEHLWQLDPSLQIVICTAYSDYTFDEMTDRLGHPERWLLLKKPFDHIEVRQLAIGLSEKWALTRKAEMQVDELERLVDERSREICVAKEQLLQAQKLESLGTLAGGIAHEFNNLLQVIRGYAQFIKTDLPEGSPMTKDFDQIISASDRAAELTKRLLGFSRRQELQRTVFEIGTLLGDLKGLLRPVIGEHIALSVNCECPHATINGDAGQLSQALLNICVNARDAMPGGGQLLLEVRRINGPPEEFPLHSMPQGLTQQHLKLTVSDTGSGMSEEVRQRIFDPFYTTKGVGEGTGLGLPFVLGVVQDHGCVMQVDSTVGKGTTFTIAVPLSVVESPDPEVGTAQPDIVPSTIAAGGKTILVTEDEPAVRKLSVRTLQAAGYTVLATSCGAEAVALFEAQSDAIDLCVLDMVLPDMNGRQIAGKLRKIRPEIPVLFCTGYDPQDQFDPEMCHAEELMLKPFTGGQLTAVVRRLTAAVEV